MQNQIKIYCELFQKNCLYEDSMYFQPFRYSDKYQIKKLAEKIVKQMIQLKPIIRKRKSRYLDYLKKLLSNLAFAYKNQKCVVVSRAAEFYSKQLESFKIVVNTLDYLIINEYIGQKLGFYDKTTGEKKSTRIWGKQKLLVNFQQLKCYDFKTRQKFDEVVIKNEDKQQIIYAITDQIKEMKCRIAKINTEYAKHSFQVYDEFLFPRIHRIYNQSSINFGGRFYDAPSRGNSYQIINKKNRRQMLIDGEQTVEIDFSGLHINMLYAIQDIQLSEYPYQFWIDKMICKDDETAEIAKQQAKDAILYLINAKKEAHAEYKLQQKHPFTDCKQLIEETKKHHIRIAKYFGSGIGITLQNIDSKIMLDIIETCHNKGIVALGIHDSVIVQKKHVEQVDVIMKAIYLKYMNKTITTKIK